MQMRKKNIEKEASKETLNTKDFESNILDRRMITGCAVSAIVSVITVFVIMKIGLNYQEEKIQEITENCSSLEAKMKSIGETISDINTSIDSLKTEWKGMKESSAYVYTGLATVQKDITAIKEILNLKSEQADDAMKKLSSDKKAFINTFENLIANGAPFGSFLDSYSEKIDLKKYHTSAEIKKFADKNVKSLTDLKRDFTAVGYSVFKTKIEESFWERQKRIIKEKISEAVKITKSKDSTSKVVENGGSDKTKYETAGKFLEDAKYTEAIEILEKLKIENEDFSNLLADIKRRKDLDDAFAEFKKEFLEMESTASEAKDEKVKSSEAQGNKESKETKGSK